MTVTFDLNIYINLLYKYQPRIIKTEEENGIFLEIVEELISRPNLTPEEDALLELLVKLIEDFEDKHYQLNISTPKSRLLHLMDARSIEAEDLGEIMGSSEEVFEIINDRLEITKKQAEDLGRFFRIDPGLFLFN
ncbi:MAG: transcriptional regulator [Microcoleus sp. CSU_2_2]|nr:transcriptional regulator [Microcoleus sp. SU_5_3]NJS09435.1 transcriptional regulator [Microcoleus sp. CSU_2_2]